MQVIEVADKELGCETGWNSQARADVTCDCCRWHYDGGGSGELDGDVKDVFTPIASTPTIASLAVTLTIPTLGVITKTIIQHLFLFQWWPLGLVRAMTYAPSTTWQQVPSQLCVSEH